MVINNCICKLSWYHYKCLIHARNRLLVELLLEHGAADFFLALSNTHVSYTKDIIIILRYILHYYMSHIHTRLIYSYKYTSRYIRTYIYITSLRGRFVSINTITTCLVVFFQQGASDKT